MKWIKAYLLCLTFFLCSAAYAQFELDNFSAIQINSEVKLTWTVKQGSTCNGIVIERSTDSLNFVFIGQIEGVCGSTSVAQQYSFTDETPVPFSKNYYRITAGTGETFHQNLFFAFVEHFIQVMSNPVSNQTMVYVESSEPFIVRFYDLSGRCIRSLNIQGNVFRMVDLLPDIPNALFLLEVEDKKGNKVLQKLAGFR